MPELIKKKTGDLFYANDWNNIVDEVNNKINKEDGKKLSSNDYTDEEKEKLKNIEDNANNYDDTEIRESIINYLQNAKDYTDESITKIIGDAPDILNSLEELANAIQNNDSSIEDISNTLINKLDKEEAKNLYVALNNYIAFTQDDKEKLNSLNNYDDSKLKEDIENKVNKVEGKELSSNDYTDIDKNKVNNLFSNTKQFITNELLKKVDKTITINGKKLDENIIITKEDISLDNVDNTTDLNKPVSNATQTELNKKVDKTITINNKPLSNNITLTKTDIGLNNVNNTSDLNKPISTATQNALDQKVTKVIGKQLSTEDFTTLLKTKLESLHNYNDTEIKQSLSELTNNFNTLVSGNTTSAIESFNEIIEFLNNIEDSTSLESIIAGINTTINNKLVEAKTYSDTKKTEAINKSKEYTDSKKIETINEAKTYSDLKKTEAISEAKKESDKKVDKVENYGLSNIKANEIDLTGKTVIVKQETKDYFDKIIDEKNISVRYPTDGVNADGSPSGNLYSLETAKIKIGANIKKGQVLSFYDKDKNGEVSKYEYDGVNWNELWPKKNNYIDDKYIKDELIDPLFGKAKGLKLKSKDNNTIAKSKIINLGVNDFTLELYACFTDVGNAYYPILGYSKSTYSQGGIKIYSTDFNQNNIRFIIFQRPDDKELSDVYNSIFLNFSKSNLNSLIHLVITRNGNIASAYIDGKLKKSVTQSEILDFSNFCLDLANSNNICLCRLFNYALSADEIVKLYNNGRPDKYMLLNSYKNIDTTTETGCIGEYVPSSLTKKVWRDTSGQGNDLAISDGAELIYTEPYKEILTGDGAPSSIPDFIDQTYIDTTNRKKYCAFGTNAVSDWKSLN